MYIEKSFSDGTYNVIMNEAELSLYSDFQELLYSDEDSDSKYPTHNYRNVIGTTAGIGGSFAGYKAMKKVGSDARGIDKVLKKEDKSWKNLFTRKKPSQPSSVSKVDPVSGYKKIAKKGNKRAALIAGGLAMGAGIMAGNALDKDDSKVVSLKEKIKRNI